MSTETLVYKGLADNGKLYTVHPGKMGHGYVYALGHRVYGTYGPARWHHDGYVHPFHAEGKWAFILAPNTASVQPETAGV